MKVIIAGGGTGGHLFPGVALADEFVAQANAEVLFIGVDGNLEKRVLRQHGYRLAALDVGGIMGGTPVKMAKSLIKQIRGVVTALGIIKEFSPDVVVGVGGYASVSAVIAAKIKGKPTAIAEQNSLPGVANRFLGMFVDRIFISLAVSARYFSRDKAMLTGNPVRKGFLSIPSPATPDDSTLTLLVCGGSQGARTINNALLGALPHLTSLKEQMTIIHQCGHGADVAAFRQAYAAAGIRARVEAFIDDMPAALQAAALVITRAGATIIAELTAAGKPAVLIPFPYAASNHQLHNARYLAEAGAGMVIEEHDLDVAALAHLIKELAGDQRRLAVMAQRAKALGKPDAARVIVAECIKMGGGAR